MHRFWLYQMNEKIYWLEDQNAYSEAVCEIVNYRVGHKQFVVIQMFEATLRESNDREWLGLQKLQP